MKNWYIELLVKIDGKIYNPCGTEYAMTYKDLKTLRGVLNRIKKWYPFNKMEKEVVQVRIYNYHNFYDKNTYTLVCEFDKYDYMFKEILNAQINNLGK